MTTLAIDDKDLQEALDRIARTPDGQLFYRLLQKKLMSVARPEAHEGALRQLEGRRMFASELMGYMSEGIADSDRYAIALTNRTDDARRPARRGAGRRVTPGTRVDGWDVPDDTPRGPGSSSGSSSPS